MSAPSERGDVPLVLAIPPLFPTLTPLIGAQVRERIDAAEAAGFSGVAVCTGHPKWGLPTDAEVEAFFASLDGSLPIRTSEVIDVDLLGVRDRDETATWHDRMLDLAARAGAESVNVISLAAELPPLAEAGARLGELCDRAADRGLAVNFEFLPWTGVFDVPGAVRLLEATDRDNLGLVLDTWHWFRTPAGPDLDALRLIPPGRLHLLQLSDAPTAVPDDLVVETLGGRLLPGDGDIDIAGVLRVLDETGAEPMIACEIFSDALSSLGAAENARRQFDASAPFLDRASATAP